MRFKKFLAIVEGFTPDARVVNRMMAGYGNRGVLKDYLIDALDKDITDEELQKAISTAYGMDGHMLRSMFKVSRSQLIINILSQ